MALRQSEKRLEKSCSERKTVVVKTRLTPSEAERIKSVIPRGLLSLAARTALLSIAEHGYFAKQEKTERQQVITALARIGNNVNQITYRMNSDKRRASPLELAAVAVELSGVRAELQALRERP